MTRLTIPLTALLLAVASAVSHGQDGGSGPGPVVSIPGEFRSTAPPTFRTRVEAIAIDVFVTDAAGNPVPGLTVDDFELEEDGKRQDITTFRAVHIPAEVEVSDFPPVDPDVASNDQPEGRIYVFALAVRDSCQALRTRALARTFIERHFGPHDLAAVVVLERGLATDGQDFTSNRRLILEAIDKFSGAGGCNDNVVPVPTGQERIVTQALNEVVTVLGRMPGRHKSLLYFNERPGYPWGDLVDYQGGVGSLTFAPGFANGLPASVMGVNSLMFDDAHRAMTTATRNNLTIYPIDPRGLEAANMSLEERMDFRALAEITGGFAQVNSNTFDETFERIVRDASTYYMLGFNSDYKKNDGKFVRLNVRVKRPGLTVRTRSGYVNMTRGEYEAQNRSRISEEPVVAAMANPVSLAGHPVRVSATPFKGTNGNANVVLTVEASLVRGEKQPRAGERSGNVQIRYVTTDARRKIYPEFRHATTLTLPVAQAEATGDRVRLVSDMELPPGRYQIRVAGGANRIGGSVVYDLEVPDFSKGPLTMSGLLLATAGTNLLPTVAPVTDKKKVKTRRCDSNECISADVREVPLVAFSPATLASTHPLRNALPAPPTTVREFRQTEAVTVFAEVYDNRPARALQVRAELKQPGQPAAITLSGDVATDKSRPSGGHSVTVNLPLAGVPPGSYVLSVEARSAEGSDVAGREIPIRIR
jgi:VWFA-related protein